MPITMYQEDPATHNLAEYHEVLYARSGAEFALVDLHGWWDEIEGKPHFNVEVLSEPHKTDEAASAAMDARVAWLESQGWTIKLSSYFDGHQGRLVGFRIP